MELFDAHNHLQDTRFDGRQADLIEQARAEDTVTMVVNGTRESDWPAVAALSRQWPGMVLPSFGLHPWFLAERSPGWKHSLDELLGCEPAAVGEIGLDRWKKDLPWDDQEDVFHQQLCMAAARERPVSIHCLQAWGPLVELLEQGPVPCCGFVLHSYGGSVETAERLAGLGAYFSLSGACAHPRRKRGWDTFRQLPPDRILLETDAPDQRLPDERVRFPLTGPGGHPLNHPAQIAEVYRFAAETLFRQPVDHFAAQVADNFRRIFGRLIPAGE